MIASKEKFFDLVAYRLGRFWDAPNLAVYFFSFGSLYIDSAQPRMRKIFSAIADVESPRFCLLTHYHEDHAGNVPYLKRKFSTVVYSSPKSKEFLSKPFRMLPYEKIIWGDFEPFEVDFVYKDTLNIGRFTFKIIETPGHSPDSVCMLETNRGWLFTGDLYIHYKMKYLRKDENVYEILDSLKRISDMNFDVMFCSHRGIIKEDPISLIRRKIDYLENLIFNTKKLYNAGVPIERIRDKLLGREDIISFVTFFDFCKLNLIKSILNLPM